MDIKTRIEDEELFHTNNHKHDTAIIKKLQSNNIYTIEDYIKGDANSIYSDELAKKHFEAIKKILKYKYNGESLDIAALLNKKHKIESKRFMSIYNHLNFSKKTIQDIFINVDDMTSLGIYGYIDIIIASRISCEIIADKMKKNGDFHIPYVDNIDGGFNRKYYEVTPLEIFKRIIIEKNDKFIHNEVIEFYVNYYDKMQSKDSIKTLEQLKQKLISLTAQKQQIDNDIFKCMEQIQNIEGKISHKR